MNTKVVRVRDLCYGDNGVGRPMLHCRTCDGRYSADAGDYFAARPSTIMRCCGRPLDHVVERCRMVTA